MLELNKSFKSIEMVMIPYRYSTIAKIIVVLMILIIMGLVYIPWQQTVVGTGQVTVFSPMERPQTIHTQIEGRIQSWYVVEGDHVKEGDLLLELKELNPKFLDKQQIHRLNRKRKALMYKQNATLQAIKAQDQQINHLSQLPKAIIPSAGLKIKQTKNKLQAAYQNYETTHLNLTRIKSLYEKGLRSKRDLELAQLNHANAKAAVEVAKQESGVAEYNQQQVTSEAFARIQSVQAELAKSHEKLASIETELVRIDIEIANLKSRKLQRTIRAPITGQVTRLLTAGRAETVKAGQQVAIIVPETSDQAVELYVRDYDAPLLSIGRHVRLQFSGWPAIQFSGWPSVSFGTFGGTIAVIDAVHDGYNRFRVIVKPDHSRIARYQDKPWPKYPLLRPGTQVQGWILLDTVALGFEIWRQINGFPPQFPKDHNEAKNFIKKTRK